MRTGPDRERFRAPSGSTDESSTDESQTDDSSDRVTVSRPDDPDSRTRQTRVEDIRGPSGEQIDTSEPRGSSAEDGDANGSDGADRQRGTRPEDIQSPSGERIDPRGESSESTGRDRVTVSRPDEVSDEEILDHVEQQNQSNIRGVRPEGGEQSPFGPYRRDEVNVVRDGDSYRLQPTEEAQERLIRERVAVQDKRINPEDVNVHLVSDEEQQFRSMTRRGRASGDVEISLSTAARSRIVHDQLEEKYPDQDFHVEFNNGEVTATPIEERYESDLPGLLGDVAERTQNETTPHATLSLSGEGLDARREREANLADEAESGAEKITSGRAPSASEAGALAFQSAELLERGIGETGRQAGRGVSRINPLSGRGPTVGGEQLGDVPTNVVEGVFAGAGMGVGAAGQLPTTATMDVAATARGDETPTGAQGGNLAIAEQFAESTYEEFKQRPVTNAALIVGPTAATRAPKAARSAKRGAARAASKTVERAGKRRFGADNRGQLDFGRRSGSSGSKSSSGKRSGELDTGIDWRQVGKGRREGKAGDVSLDIGGRGPRRGLEGRRDFAQKVREQRAQERSAAAAAAESGRSDIVSGELSRLGAAGEPSWRADDSLDGSTERLLNIDIEAETARAGLMAEAQQRSVDIGMDPLSETSAVQEPAVTVDDTLTGVRDRSGQAQEPGLGQRGGGRGRGRSKTGTRPGTGTMTGARTGTRVRERVGLRAEARPRQRDRFDFDFQRRTARPRRVPWPDSDFAVGGGLGLDSGGLGSLGSADRELSPGWFSETVTTIGTIGMETPGTPGQSELESAPIGLRLTGELPTSQMLEGDESVEAAGELFDFSGPSDGGDEFDFGLDVGFDLDLGGDL